MAWPVNLVARNVEDRQPDVERGIGIAQIVDRLDRAVPHPLERPRIAHRDEWRQAEGGAIVPAFGDHLRADPGGVSKRNCERW